MTPLTILCANFCVKHGYSITDGELVPIFTQKIFLRGSDGGEYCCFFWEKGRKSKTLLVLQTTVLGRWGYENGKGDLPLKFPFSSLNLSSPPDFYTVLFALFSFPLLFFESTFLFVYPCSPKTWKNIEGGCCCSVDNIMKVGACNRFAVEVRKIWGIFIILCNDNGERNEIA